MPNDKGKGRSSSLHRLVLGEGDKQIMSRRELKSWKMGGMGVLAGEN